MVGGIEDVIAKAERMAAEARKGAGMAKLQFDLVSPERRSPRSRWTPCRSPHRRGHDGDVRSCADDHHAAARHPAGRRRGSGAEAAISSPAALPMSPGPRSPSWPSAALPVSEVTSEMNGRLHRRGARGP